MSTDWIKMRVDLRTHPKVDRMASALKADELRVIGGLFAVWSIFDAHSTDGVLEGYTFGSIDRKLGWKGFAQAMAAVEWLEQLEGDGLEMPRFDTHNGKSAKRRATDTERKREDRKAEKDGTGGGQNADEDADSLRTTSRPEKRREEKKEKETTEASLLVERCACDALDAPKSNGKDPPYRVPDCPYDALLASFHEELPTLPRVGVFNDARKAALRARWVEVCAAEKFDQAAGLAWFRDFFGKVVGGSDFLTGRAKDWKANLDWLTRPKNFAKTVDGNYRGDRA